MANRLGWFLGLFALLILIFFWLIPWDRPVETTATPTSPSSAPFEPPRRVD